MSRLQEESAILSMLHRSSPKLSCDNSIKYLSKSLRSSLDLQNPKDFLPFINERDSTGHLLPPSTFNSTYSKPFQAEHSKKHRRGASNVVFFKSKNATSSRVCKKSNNSLPVGLYNPNNLNSIHFPVSKSSRFLLQKKLRRSSIDYIDINEAYNKNKSNLKKTVSMDKQLPRNIIEEQVISDQKFLIPRVVLPDYLNKLKGLYHSGALAQSKIYKIRKDATEKTLELKDQINKHMASLRNINTFYKQYGMKCSWKLSSELF